MMKGGTSYGDGMMGMPDTGYPEQAGYPVSVPELSRNTRVEGSLLPRPEEGRQSATLGFLMGVIVGPEGNRRAEGNLDGLMDVTLPPIRPSRSKTRRAGLPKPGQFGGTQRLTVRLAAR